MTAVLVLAAPAEAAKKKRKRARATAKQPEPPAVPRPHDPSKVTFTTSDGVVLAASWRPAPNDPQAPAVLLLHDFSRDRRTWDDVAFTLTARGLATLALDLRGHGESTRKTSGAVVKLSPRLLTSPGGFPVDVSAACRWLKSRAPRVGVLGLSLGGNLAVLATASRWADAGVAVSANTERLGALAGTLPTKPRGLLVLAAEQDTGRAESARMLEAAAGEEPRKTVVYPGAGHNLGLFTAHPAAWDEVLGWLTSRLAPTP